MLLHAGGVLVGIGEAKTEDQGIRLDYFGGRSLSGSDLSWRVVSAIWSFALRAITLCVNVGCFVDRCFFKSDLLPESIVVSNPCFGLS